MLQTFLRLIRRSKPLGARGEDAAADHLRSLGWRILDRNVRVPMGEADIVAESDSGEVVLVEVKCRVLDDRAHPPPERQVGPRKAAKLRAIMQHLSRANDWEKRRKRIDVVAIDWPREGKPVIRHFRDICTGR